MAPLTAQEISQHNSAKSCWVIIQNRVYDVTDFLPAHPGGSKIILKYAGKDATEAYEPIHPKGTLEEHLPKDKHLGPLAAQDITEKKERPKTKDELRVEREQRMKPPISRMLSIRDLEGVARKVLSFKALSYYASAGDDEVTATQNERAYSRFFFAPRVLRKISTVDLTTKILGYDSPLPIFVSAAALAKLGHPLGEINIVRGAGRTGIIQMVSTNASCSITEMSEAKLHLNQVQFFQLYKNRDTSIAEALIRKVESLGYKAIFLTVDAPVAGNRERDIRVPFAEEDEHRAEGEGESGTTGEKPRRSGAEEEEEEEGSNEVGGTAGALLKNDDLNITWEETIPWLRRITKLPIVLKGIQSVADAVLAADAGVDGILISNHGGRQLDYSMPTIEVLYRLRQQRPDCFDKMEVFVDGGIRRGTDVLKALCLGAKAVGMGRPFLYAQSAYGEAGVIKLIRIMERELLTGMRLLGATKYSELKPEMVERVDFEARL
ncbi:hypothetical protein SISSUDRAFT_1065055 [Sistotremastrum suecicum HHB10207 ss-3]|uniref:L-lactate dehydrogenase (cytochrome) n=1 Tax=Sistotremastrum suecicum HHB10207 ss-3 TaxID=1314776 RepID=A0A165ZXP6_9AGAM|nr:hypothetical protein SISSUDRAFT_1065055 [Sistotremastrum suecicum HHB10207 ss-3]